MKRTTILFACAALAMAGCSKNDGGHAPAGEVELRLAAGIEAATRGDVQSTAIVPGETVWAWVSDAGAEAGAGALYNAVKLTAGDGGTLAGTTTMYFPQTGNGVDIRALHGTFAAGTITEDQTAFPDGFDFTVATDQSGATGQSLKVGPSPEDAPSAADHTNYVRSDLLYAAADDVGRTQGAVQLKFYHMLSKLELRIKKGAGVTDDITGATLDNVAVDGTFTPGTAADLTQQTVRAGMIAAGTTTGAITLGTALMGDDPENIVSNDAIVVPQEVAGKTMTFTLKSGAQLVYTLPEGKPFESGKKHVYTVTLTLTGLTVTSAVEPWTGTEPVDGEATMPIPAKVGDYFYSDGTFSTDLDRAKTVIGIVFQTDKSRIGDAEKEKLGGEDKVHGLVMAVKNAGTSPLWSLESKDFAELTDCKTKADNYNDISGLHNYNTVIAYAGSDKLSSYPAFKAAYDYNTACPVPKTTTGWYLPASGQWWDILQNLGGCPDLADKSEQTSLDDRNFSWSGQGDVPAALNRWMADIDDGNKNTFSSGNYCWSSLGDLQQRRTVLVRGLRWLRALRLEP